MFVLDVCYITMMCLLCVAMYVHWRISQLVCSDVPQLFMEDIDSGVEFRLWKPSKSLAIFSKGGLFVRGMII